MPRTRFGVLWRAILACVVVVGCAAGAVATAGLLQVKQVVDDLNLSKALPTTHLTPPLPGQPETLLLVGVDHRYGEGDGPGNTDTMMLVRIDDSSTTINTLSIPRDLGVQIPGYGYGKLNAAYADGGESLLIETIKDDVFPDLKVNHVLIVDFASFANLINAIGCVYIQSDQRYYNHSIGPADPTTNYSSIDIYPGYQKLCGGSGSDLGGPNTALAFVRFRHNDSDLVRESRQQDFLEWAKQSLPSGQTLLGMEPKLARYFGEDVQTDKFLQSTDGVDELFGLAFNADGHAVKSIPFPYTGVLQPSGNLTFDTAAAEQAYHTFITPTRPPKRSTATHTAPPPTASHRTKPHTPSGPPPAPAGMRADPGDGRSQAGQLGNPGLPVYYPYNIPDDYGYCFTITANCNIGYEPASAYRNTYPRHYSIEGQDGKKYPAYVMTLVVGSGGYTDTATGEYFTVEGTTWRDPPILRDPTSVKDVDGKLLAEYYQGGSLVTVAWRTKTGVYWISNTLQNNVPNGQMVAMAASFTRASG